MQWLMLAWFIYRRADRRGGEGAPPVGCGTNSNRPHAALLDGQANDTLPSVPMDGAARQCARIYRAPLTSGNVYALTLA